MAARKKSTKNGRSKSVDAKRLPPIPRPRRKKPSGPEEGAARLRASRSRQRPPKEPRAAKRPADEANAPAKNNEDGEPAERTQGNGRRGEKQAPTGGAKKKLNRGTDWSRRRCQSNGNGGQEVAGRKARKKSKPTPSSEEPTLKSEKIGQRRFRGRRRRRRIRSGRGYAGQGGSRRAQSKSRLRKDEIAARRRPPSRRSATRLQVERVRRLSGARRRADRGDRGAGSRRLQAGAVRHQLLQGQDDACACRPRRSSGVGMRKISDPDTAKRSLDILSGRARIKRTMWSRRAQEYETKINSGDITAIAEVVRDLYRSEAQPEQSYSERQLYEAALDRMVREIAAVQKSNEIDALKAIEAQLQKTHEPSGEGGRVGGVRSGDRRGRLRTELCRERRGRVYGWRIAKSLLGNGMRRVGASSPGLKRLWLQSS